jgi:Bifunctional DNA primase/polymerase, N-terminal/AAA domain
MPRSLADAALAYAERGIAIFPLWGITKGRCDCSRDCGRDAGKHPLSVLVRHGLKEATTDREQIRRWWAAYPNANIGIVLGDLVVIDEDQPGAILAAGLELPNGPVSRTGRGHHYLFRPNGQALLNGNFAPGLDCKTGEAYIVAPPSQHLSGKRYEWVAGHGLEDVELSSLPETVERIIVEAHVNAGHGAAGDNLHDLFGRLKLEDVFLTIEKLAPDSGDQWRQLMLRIVRSLVGRNWRDDAIMMMCRRATRRDLGFTHERTDAFVTHEIRRTRCKDKTPEPDEETFDQVDGAAPQPDGTKGAAVKPKRTDWLWHPYFPAGELSLIGARGGVGKGQACASIVARLTTGMLWPDGAEKALTGHVLWAEAEDSIDKTVVPRLIANRADLDRVTFFNEEEFAALDVRRFVEEHDARAVILSPIMSFLPKLKSHIDELAVRAELKKLRAAISGTACALIGIAHLNKKTDLDAIERLLGSVAFANFVRSVILLAKDKQRADLRRWVHAKHNLSVKGGDLLFETQHVGEDPRDQYVRVGWEIPAENIDVDSLYERQKPGDRRLSARDWLVAHLEENGRSLATEVIEAGIKAGYSKDTITKAQYREQRIDFDKEGFPAQVWWFLK